MLDHIVGARASHRGDHGGFVVEPRQVAEAHRVPRPKLEAEKILKRARDALAPIVSAESAPDPRRRQGSALVGLIEPAQQLHQRALARAVLADDRDHRACFSSRFTSSSTWRVVPG